jgi:hypothetical protein
MRVLIAGASGFLGTKLTQRLRTGGHEVVRLVRREAAAPDEVSWDPGGGVLDPAAISTVEAVVSLTGSPLGSRVGPVQLPLRPWTRRYREWFRAARVDATTTLARAVATADPRPRALLVGSADGYYGDTGKAEVDESAGPGEGYLPGIVRQTEEATRPAAEAGVRVVLLRTGFPLHRDGGYLGPQLLPFRLGLGGKVASGRQWQPWISLADWLEAVVFLLERDDVAGPVNLVGPQPATNAQFTRTLGRLLHRPTVMPLAAPLVRLLVGEFGRDAVASRKVVPGVLARAGFTFRHPDLASALRAALYD